MRNPGVDALRGLAMILVVLGHAIQYGTGNPDSKFDNPVFAAIYAFHMPLFALVMGYVLAPSVASRPFNENVSRRARSLLIPFLAWSVLIGALRLARYDQWSPADAVAEVFQAVICVGPMGGVWFLWFAFCASVLLAYVQLVPTRWVPLALVAAWLGTLAVPLEYGLAWYQLRWLLPFVVLGYVARNDPRFLRVASSRPVLVAAAVVAAACLVGWEARFSVYLDPRALPGGDLGSAVLTWSYRYVFALAGVVIAVALGRRLSSTWLRGPLAAIGRESLGIYCLQSVAFLCLEDVLARANTPILLPFAVPVVAGLVLGASCAGARVLMRFTPTRVALLGGRGAPLPARLDQHV